MVILVSWNNLVFITSHDPLGDHLFGMPVHGCASASIDSPVQALAYNVFASYKAFAYTKVGLAYKVFASLQSLL